MIVTRPLASRSRSSREGAVAIGDAVARSSYDIRVMVGKTSYVLSILFKAAMPWSQYDRVQSKKKKGKRNISALKTHHQNRSGDRNNLETA